MTRKIHLRSYSLNFSRQQLSKSLLLVFLLLIQRDFWRGAVNIALLVFVSAYTICRWLSQGMFEWWWPLQLLIMPGLMALEELCHAVVALHKGLPQNRLELVSIYRRTTTGIYWLCQGAAIRIREPVSPADRIHISAPGPLIDVLLAMLLWTICGLFDGHFFWGRTHLAFVPMMVYFLGTFLPTRALPNDISNILKARREAGYDWAQTSRAYWHGVVLLFSERTKHKADQAGS